MMHAWQPEYIERHYVHQRKSIVTEIDENKATLKTYTPELLAGDLYYGFFAMLTAEVGDIRTTNMLLNQTDEIYEKKWVDGKSVLPSR